MNKFIVICAVISLIGCSHRMGGTKEDFEFCLSNARQVESQCHQYGDSRERCVEISRMNLESCVRFNIGQM